MKSRPLEGDLLARKLSREQKNLLDLHGLSYEIRYSVTGEKRFYAVCWMDEWRLPVMLRLDASIEFWIAEIDNAKKIIWGDSPHVGRPLMPDLWADKMIGEYERMLSLPKIAMKAPTE